MITIIGNNVTYNGKTFTVVSAEKLNDEAYLLHTNTGAAIRFDLSVEVNGEPMASIEEIFEFFPAHVTKEPNWNGLTQSLKNSALMLFALGYANSNGFSLLLKTLTDGEINSASEQFLLVAIGACFPQGWPQQLSAQQKSDLNALLTANNFSVQVS